MYTFPLHKILFFENVYLDLTKEQILIHMI